MSNEVHSGMYLNMEQTKTPQTMFCSCPKDKQSFIQMVILTWELKVNSFELETPSPSLSIADMTKNEHLSQLW